MSQLEIAENDIEPNRVTSKTMQFKQETAKDSVLASLCDVVTSGWPAERKETQSIKTVLEFQMRFLSMMKWCIILTKTLSLHLTRVPTTPQHNVLCQKESLSLVQGNVAERRPRSLAQYRKSILQPLGGLFVCLCFLKSTCAF